MSFVFALMNAAAAFESKTNNIKYSSSLSSMPWEGLRVNNWVDFVAHQNRVQRYYIFRGSCGEMLHKSAQRCTKPD